MTSRPKEKTGDFLRKPVLRTVVLRHPEKIVVVPGEERTAGLTADRKKELENGSTLPSTPVPPEVSSYSANPSRLQTEERFPLQPMPEEVIRMTQRDSIRAFFSRERVRAALLGILIGAGFVIGGSCQKCSPDNTPEKLVPRNPHP